MFIIRWAPVREVDVAGMKCKAGENSRHFCQYNLPSSSINICCLNSMEVGVAPVHNAGCIT